MTVSVGVRLGGTGVSLGDSVGEGVLVGIKVGVCVSVGRRVGGKDGEVVGVAVGVGLGGDVGVAEGRGVRVTKPGEGVRVGRESVGVVWVGVASVVAEAVGVSVLPASSARWATKKPVQ